MKKLILSLTLITAIARSCQISPEKREKNLVWLQMMRNNIESVYQRKLKEAEHRNSKLECLLARDRRDQAFEGIDEFIKVNVQLFY